MKTKKTARGFSYIEFETDRGELCNIQMSSSVDPHIWLGHDKEGIRGFFPYGKESWMELYPEDIKPVGGIACDTLLCNSRMHLDVETVKKLIPILQHFVDTEELPEVDDEL